MREADVEVLLHLVERLSDEQRTALGRALASASGEPEAVRLLERAFAAAPRCPHCGARPGAAWSRRTRPSFAAPIRVPADGAAATPRPDEGRAGAASGRASPASRPSRSRP